MKKLLILLAFLVVMAGTCILFKVFTVTEPYVIKPINVVTATSGAPVNHVINTNTGILSVFSSNLVVVVADPGASFQHEVLWLVAVPRTDQSRELKEYRFKMPKFAMAEHVNEIGVALPDKIRKAANGWN